MTDGVEADLDRRQMQAAINQSVFREVNESLEKLNRDFSDILSEFIAAQGEISFCRERPFAGVPYPATAR